MPASVTDQEAQGKGEGRVMQLGSPPPFFSSLELPGDRRNREVVCTEIPNEGEDNRIRK